MTTWAGKAADLLAETKRWWTTRIIDIRPGEIRIKGRPIETLIGHAGYARMVWLMLRDDEPTPAQLALLEAALVAAVDHGPQAPSIAIARMAVTCGAPLNAAMASAINVLDGVHGGAGEQCLQLYADVLARANDGLELEAAVHAALDAFVAAHGKMIPGFGHRFHPVDPRSVRLLALVEDAVEAGAATGRYARVGRLVERALEQRTGTRIPMNIDGATAVVYGELNFAPPLARGLFILSRSVGILAHAWEQKQQGGRIKGPLPPAVGYTYAGDD
ncbi:citryl-CoA lyase [Paraburkholderia caballeronis]|uniref:citryl-CoA lyase n=1 Tax=Paraburkholderia caballeronis TaxID=416943 RepID=UPI001066E9BF|nr:citryl-CoA lyase [Paraburkholderia caballeronis]TDV06147.1 citrate synthase [Paraburkholderia caballeronis]TDV09687.1 citrate synthase [Paraburkholderia caballeronis]TDV21752.1 citrate synthase [Paraburkholderia caballeronis]